MSKQEQRTLSDICRTTTCDCHCHSLNDICAECGQEQCAAFKDAYRRGL